MRERHHLGPLAVQAIGGTAVLMLGFDPDEGSATELLGFAVRRTDHTYLVRRWAELRRTRLRGRATDDPRCGPRQSGGRRRHHRERRLGSVDEGGHPGRQQARAFIHTKFMLVDPLGHDPPVITWSGGHPWAALPGPDVHLGQALGPGRVLPGKGASHVCRRRRH